MVCETSYLKTKRKERIKEECRMNDMFDYVGASVEEGMEALDIQFEEEFWDSYDPD